jgi:FAD synthetase|tara:strand:- start:47 stop:454 length:408 start_codon:yes stop_codon:yes gene_type:complete
MGKKVLVTGTFDIVHPGHLNMFSQAKKYGDLIILVARDDTVEKIKGKMPVHSAEFRKNQLITAKIAKKVLIGNEDKYKVLDDEKPDFICLGYDQDAFVDDLEKEIIKRGLKTKIIRLEAFKPELYKTSKFIDTLK